MSILKRSFARKAIIQRIHSNTVLLLDALSGMETIPASKDIFTAVDFETSNNWSLDAFQKGKPTMESEVKIFKVTGHANSFKEVFSAVKNNPEKNCYLTQHQILNFIKKHSNLLVQSNKKAGGTMFLFTSNDKPFVASVHRYPDNSLGICCDTYDGKHEFSALKTDDLIVVPAL